jgi:hypothetical protein
MITPPAKSASSYITRCEPPEGCCMCTCIVSLTAQVRLICSWCLKICLRSAARICVERLISVQTDMQTEIDMETNMVLNMGDKSVYIRAFWPREDQSINKSKKHPK